ASLAARSMGEAADALARALEKSGKRKARQRCGCEERGRLAAGELPERAHQVFETAFLERGRRFFELVGCAMNVRRRLRQLRSEVISGAMHGRRGPAHLLGTGGLLLLGGLARLANQRINGVGKPCS